MCDVFFSFFLVFLSTCLLILFLSFSGSGEVGVFMSGPGAVFGFMDGILNI